MSLPFKPATNPPPLSIFISFASVFICWTWFSWFNYTLCHRYSKYTYTHTNISTYTNIFVLNCVDNKRAYQLRSYIFSLMMSNRKLKLSIHVQQLHLLCDFVQICKNSLPFVIILVVSPLFSMPSISFITPVFCIYHIRSFVMNSCFPKMMKSSLC